MSNEKQSLIESQMDCIANEYPEAYDAIQDRLKQIVDANEIIKSVAPHHQGFHSKNGDLIKRYLIRWNIK